MFRDRWEIWLNGRAVVGARVVVLGRHWSYKIGVGTAAQAQRFERANCRAEADWVRVSTRQGFGPEVRSAACFYLAITNRGLIYGTVYRYDLVEKVASLVSG